MTKAKRLLMLLNYKNIITDSFNRADNATSLGSTDTGQAWTKVTLGSSGIFGIISNKAYMSSIAAFSTIYAYLESGYSDVEVSVDVTYYSYATVFLRYVDSNNLVRLRFSSTGISLIKVVNGTTTVITSYAMTPVQGATYNLKISASGTTIKCYLNDTLVIESIVASNATGTKVGIMYYSGTTSSANLDRFDNFICNKI